MYIILTLYIMYIYIYMLFKIPVIFGAHQATSLHFSGVPWN